MSAIENPWSHAQPTRRPISSHTLDASLADSDAPRTADAIEAPSDPSTSPAPLFTREWTLVLLETASTLCWLPTAGYATLAYGYGTFATAQTFYALIAFVASLTCILAIGSFLQYRNVNLAYAYVSITLFLFSFIGVAILWIAPISDNASAILETLGNICLGGCCGGYLLLWSSSISRFSGRQVAVLIVIVAIFQAGVYSAITVLAPRQDCYLIASITGLLVSTVVFCWHLRGQRDVNMPIPLKNIHDSSLLRQSISHLDIRMFVMMFLIGLSFSVMTYQFGTATHGRIASYTWIMLFIGIVATSILLVIGYARNHDVDAVFAFHLSCIFVIPAFFPFEAGTELSLHFAFDFDAISFMVVTIMAFVLLTSIERDLQRIGISGIGFAWLGLAVGMLIGFPISFYIVSLSKRLVTISGLLSTLAVFVATNILVTDEPVRRILLIAANKYPLSIYSPEQRAFCSDDAGDAPDRTVSACKVLALEKCLSERETEVLLILARGNNLSRVQEELFISEGTAITHRRHIYQKLGVHSKQELLDIVEKRKDRL